MLAVESLGLAAAAAAKMLVEGEVDGEDGSDEGEGGYDRACDEEWLQPEGADVGYVRHIRIALGRVVRTAFG